MPLPGRKWLLALHEGSRQGTCLVFIHITAIDIEACAVSWGAGIHREPWWPHSFLWSGQATWQSWRAGVTLT